MKNLFKFLLVLTFGALVGCASIPIPKVSQAKAAVAVGCAALEAAGCFDDVQDVFPALDAGSCPDRIGYLFDLAEAAQKNADVLKSVPKDKIIIELWDPTKVDIPKLARLRNAKCGKIGKALGAK